MALELPLLPETLPEDVEDVSWGLQTAAALWSRGDKTESVVWLRRAADAARGAGQEGRAQTLLKSASDLEGLLAASPPSSVRPSDEPLRVLPPVGSSTPGEPPRPAPVVAPPPPLAALASALAPQAPAPTPLERNVTQEIEDFESLDPEAAEDLFSEEETHELGPGDPLPNKPLSAAPAASPPAAPAAAPAAPSAPAPAPSAASSSTPHAGEVVITTKPDAVADSPARVAASQKKRQREPILDPWSDDMPPSDPPPRTQHHRPDLPSDDDDVMTSAPVLDVSLKRKPPPPPPKPRSQTLTGQPIPSGTVLAALETSPESARPKADSPAPSAVDGRPPPPPTRKLTTPSMQAVSFPSAVPDAGNVVNAPPPPSRERKSVPPPPPPRPPMQTMPLAPDAPVVSPEPSAEVAQASAGSAALPSAEVKSEPPPPTMPAAQQRQSRPEPDDLLAAIDLPKESLPKEPLSAEERAQVAAPRVPEPPPVAPPAPAPPAPPPAPAAAPAPATARAPSIPPPPPRAPSRPPPRPASAPPPAPASSVSPPAPPRPASVLPPPPFGAGPAPAASAPPVTTAPPVTRPRASTIPPAQRSIGGLSLDQVDIFSDLSGEIQKLLCDGASVVELGIEEEVAVAGAAIVLSGSGAVCPTVADAAASHLAQAALVPGLSTLAEPTRIRIVATGPATIASWDRAQLEAALKSCPWVLEDLQRLGDRLCALAGATMGALGDLDEGSRLAAFERLTLRVLAPGEVLVAAGGELGGLNVVGAGAILVAKPDGAIEYSVGDVVLPETVLEGGTTIGEVRAGAGGALLLSASRMVTVELFSILPSLIELLR